MSIIKCKICNKDFYVKASHQKNGNGKYCSVVCRSMGQRRGENRKCTICGESSWKSPLQLKRSKSKKYFCSKNCQTRWRNTIYVGANHKNWKGGSSSYRQRLIRVEQKVKCGRCGIADLRILSAHHKDADRSNNNLDNLEWLCLNCHFLEHRYKK